MYTECLPILYCFVNNKRNQDQLVHSISHLLLQLSHSDCQSHLDEEPPVDGDAARVSSVGVARVCLDTTMVGGRVVGHGHALGTVVLTLLQS